MSVRITQWVGRLGNNIQQVVLATCTALALDKCQVQMPAHPLLRPILITGVGSGEDLVGDFFKMTRDESRWLEQYFDRCMALIRVNMAVNPRVWETFPQHMSLLIHLRGGDIYEKPHPAYPPAPASYFVKLIKSKPWTSVNIIAQTGTPTLALLRHHCQQVHIGRPLLQDLAHVVGHCSHLAMDVGTFIPGLAALRSRPVEIYNPLRECPQYYARMGKWQRTPEQLKLITTWEHKAEPVPVSSVLDVIIVRMGEQTWRTFGYSPSCEHSL